MDTKAYYGPGYWAAMHIDSFNAKTYEKRIGKQTVSFEEAVKKWGDEAICFETGCDDD